MEFDLSEHTEKKYCPFCAELILAKAIKCRYCGEFLNTPKAKSVLQTLSQNDDPDETDAEDQADNAQLGDVLFEATPSLFGMAGTFLRAMFFIALAIFLIKYPLEKFVKDRPVVDNTQIELTENSSGLIADVKANVNPQVISRYRHIAGFTLIGLVLMGLVIKTVNLKCIHYEVTPERIEWSRGILDRRVDNLDMFRVVDVSLRRSLLDCIFFIGSVKLVTTDKTDPHFQFLKVHQPRQLYNIIKVASLKADKRNSVVHLEG